MKKVLLALAGILIFHSAQANHKIWGQNGHRIVGKICYDNLSPKARKKIDAILGNRFLSEISTWSDYVKSEDEWDFAKSWHYMTVQPHETVEEVVERNAGNDRVDDVYEGIQLMQKVLEGNSAVIEQFEALIAKNKAKKLNNSLDATALAFLLHFVGDIHQPMHVGKNRDLGGNKIAVQFFGERYSLHSLWDSGIIEQEDLSFTEFSMFIEKHQSANKPKWEKDPLSIWAQESITHRETIYNTLYDGRTDRETGLPDLSYQYQHDFLPLLEERLAAAGYRAAFILNTIFG